MPRAHRWDPDAIIAVSFLKNVENDEVTPVQAVNFCPLAAKGSQNASAAETRQNNIIPNDKADDDEDDKNSNNNNNNLKSATVKRNVDDIVSATVFWLVDQDINRVIGRLEKEGLVNILDDLLNKNKITSPILLPLHLQSHQEYREFILANLKTEGQRNFFVSEFVENPAAEKKKFGNMAVCVENVVKCAHALVGQYFANVTCPLGELVAKFILFLGSLAGKQKQQQQQQKEEEINNRKNDDNDDEDQKVKSATSSSSSPDWKENLMPLFVEFSEKTLSDNSHHFVGKINPSVERNKLTTTDVTVYVDAAKNILESFAEAKGEGKGRRRKRRTD